MKKYLVLFLAVVMLLSLAVSVSAKDYDFDEPAVDFDFQPMISVTTEDFTYGGADGGHGNHQTRIVHTSYGDYIAEISNYTDFHEIDGGAYSGLIQLSVTVTPTGSTETEVLLQHVMPRSTSQISVIADNDENIWAGVIVENGFRNQFDNHGNSCYITLYRITPEGEVTQYDTILERIDKNGGGTGYASFFYDDYTNTIICFTDDGVATDPSYMYWKVFDVETLSFEKEVNWFQVNGGRAGYPFFQSDGNGGYYVVTNRNPSYNSPVSYFPEVCNFEGVSKEDLVAEFGESGRADTVEYAFDMVVAYHVPNLHSSEGVTNFMVAGPDYSRVKGTLAERKTLAYRKTNEYPCVAFNNGGDLYLDDEGNLHTTVKIYYRNLAWNWDVTDSTWVHIVNDAETGEELSRSIVWKEVEYNPDDPFNGVPNHWNYDISVPGGILARGKDARFYHDPVTDELFIVSNYDFGIGFFKCVGTPEDGYTYELAGYGEYPEIKDRFNRKRSIGSLNGAPHRSNAIADEVISYTGTAPWNFELFRINLDYHEKYSDVTISQNVAKRGDITYNAPVSENGRYLYYEDITVNAAAKPGYNFLGWYENGALVSDKATFTFKANEHAALEAVFSEPIVYTITYNTKGAIKNENPVTYTVESPDIVLKTPVKPLGSFRGWTCEGEVLNGSIKLIPTGTYGDLVLTASWIPYPDSASSEEIKTEPKEPVPSGIEVIIPEAKDDEPAVIDVVEKEPEDVVEEPVEKTIPFVDVPDDLFDDVLYLFDKGIMIGVSDTEFGTDVTLNRAMVVTILWRMEGEPAVNYDMTFEDVEADQWYTEAIRWAASEGIVLGYSDVKFGPKDNITNEQLVTILFRYAKTKGYNVGVGEDTNILSFEDAADIHEYAIPAVQEACGAGIMFADAEGYLYPTADATRGGTAGIIHRFLAYYVD